MHERLGRIRNQRLWPPALAVGAIWLFAPVALALTPDSPEVQTALQRAVDFLNSQHGEENRLATDAITAWTFLQSGAGPSHPSVATAVAAIQTAVGNRNPVQARAEADGAAAAVVLLVALDSRRYSADIITLLKVLELHQESAGGWHGTEGDAGKTATTQFALFAFWTAGQAGFSISMPVVERGAVWLLNAQDVNGGYGPQGRPAGSAGTSEKSDVRAGATAAGLAGLYLSADLLGLTERADPRAGDVPSALKEVKAKPATELSRAKSRMDPKLFKDGLARGNRWMRTSYQFEQGASAARALFALEQYWSFRDLIEGKPEKEPKWYTDGAQLLIRSQLPAGSWESDAGDKAGTAYSLLMLMRSTKRCIARFQSYGSGSWAVSQGLPATTDDVEVRKGRVVVKSSRAPAEVLAAAFVGSPDADLRQALEAIDQLSLDELQVLVAKFPRRLEQMAVEPAPLARLLAIRVLGRTRSMETVPMLVHALGDGDRSVAGEAREALQRTFRRWDTEKPDLSLPANRGLEIERWKARYLAIRPDAILDE